MAGVFHAGLSHSYPIPMWIDDDVCSLVLGQGFVCKTKFVVCSEDVIVFPCNDFDFYQQFRPFSLVVSIGKFSRDISVKCLWLWECSVAWRVWPALLQEEVGQKDVCRVGEYQHKHYGL